MIEQLLVALIVAAASIACAWHLAPITLRLQFAGWLRSTSRGSAVGPALVRAASAPTGNCAGCGARGQCPVGKSLSRR